MRCQESGTSPDLGCLAPDAADYQCELLAGSYLHPDYLYPRAVCKVFCKRQPPPAGQVSVSVYGSHSRLAKGVDLLSTLDIELAENTNHVGFVIPDAILTQQHDVFWAELSVSGSSGSSGRPRILSVSVPFLQRCDVMYPGRITLASSADGIINGMRVYPTGGILNDKNPYISLVDCETHQRVPLLQLSDDAYIFDSIDKPYYDFKVEEVSPCALFHVKNSYLEVMTVASDEVKRKWVIPLNKPLWARDRLPLEIGEGSLYFVSTHVTHVSVSRQSSNFSCMSLPLRRSPAFRRLHVPRKQSLDSI